MVSLERDPRLASVFRWAALSLTTSTYHRPASRRSRRTSIALTLAAVLAWAAFAAGGALAAPSTLIVEGAGDGHGVGMSQWGAEGFARHGWTDTEILAHYYTGTTLGLAPAGAVIRVLEGSKVVRVPLERYVRGVVAAEMPSSWPAAALQAQAIASRTYALTAHAGGSRFDVYADTRSQVYLGVAAETSPSNAAVAATAGQIVLYDGRPAATYFFASSGGETEDIANAFIGSEPEPWLVGVSDPYDVGAPFDWKLSLPFSAAAARLRGLYRGSFRGIEVLQRGVSPRIVSAEVLGSAGSSRVSGPDLAARLGLDSTWAYFSVASGRTVTPEPDRSGAPTGPLPTTAPPPAPAPAPKPVSTPQGGAQAPGAPVTAIAGGVLAG